MVLTRGGDDPALPTPTATPSRTPLAIEPGAPTAPPKVTAKRTGTRIGFTWQAADRARPSDTYEWKRDDTGESRRTADTRLVVTDPGKVCLIRESFASGWAQECG